MCGYFAATVSSTETSSSFEREEQKSFTPVEWVSWESVGVERGDRMDLATFLQVVGSQSHLPGTHGVCLIAKQ